MTSSQYVRDGAEIYRRSFATIRAEADLDGLDPLLERAVVRMIHACGMVDLAADVAASAGFARAAHAALRDGAPILCDTSMVASGITRARLPAANEVVCTLADPRVPALAEELATTRTAAAIELWRDRLEGALVVVGNAPTALFRLLELVEEGAGRPAGVVGVPVGFIGAAESKVALAEHPAALEHLVVHGRRGGSAIAAAAVNALAGPAE
jgi:precorrin-8X/cobalt-precorrin-8 methylmutase